MIQTLDRSRPPAVQQAGLFDLPSFESGKLSNDIPMHLLASNELDLVRIELVFRAGRSYETDRMAAAFCSRLLREGSAGFTGPGINETLDFHGATLSLQSGLEFSTVKLICLPRFLRPVLEVVGSFLSEPVFPQADLDRQLNIARQKLRVNMEKNEFLASRKFSEVLFGADHPFGFHPEDADYDRLGRSQLVGHFERMYHAGSVEIFVAGRMESDSIRVIDELLAARIQASKGAPERRELPFAPDAEKLHRIRKEGSNQAALRLGYTTINKDVPEYDHLRIVNVLFGGYFGSRLMHNIREEKGYTYGISSVLTSLMQSGYLMIGTEVGLEYVDPTLEEISKEIDRLHNERADDSELEMLRNYMLGSLTARVDGVFRMANVLKDLHIFGLKNADHRRYMQVIRDVSSEDIQNWAQRYLSYEKMYKVIVE